MKFSFFFLVLCIGLFGVVFFASAQNAVLYFSPSSGTYAPGQTFQVSIMADTKGQEVNAIAAHFSYPQAQLVVTATAVESGLTEFHKSAGSGIVKIDAGKFPPGLINGVQKVGSVTFRVQTGASGVAALSFLNDSAILRNSDSQNILSLPSSGTANLQIGQSATTPPPPTPPTPEPIGETTPQPTPPIPSEPATLQISSLQAQQVTSNSVRISWKTNKQASARIDYGVGGIYMYSVVTEQTGQEHSLLVTGLEEEPYQFQVKSVTAEGEVAFVESISLQELLSVQEEGGLEPGSGLSVPVPEQIEVAGFQFTTTSIILFVGLPIVVFIVIALLVIQRIRKKRLGR